MVEAIPILVSYQCALFVLGVLCLTILIQSFLNAPLAFISEEQVPGMPLKSDHSKLSFRVLRTYANSVENLPAFGWALFVAIVAGASPALVNWLAGIYLFFRLAYWAVYYSGRGKIAGGPRTICYVGGWLTNAVLAVMAIYAVMMM